MWISVKTPYLGVLPDKMKIAKSGESDVVSNYRTISILPVFSELPEKILYNRVYEHITTNNLLYEKQFAFQNKSSTELYLAQELSRERS